MNFVIIEIDMYVFDCVLFFEYFGDGMGVEVIDYVIYFGSD